ncbi:MAG TPA: DUF2807 domain-containing protein [Pedobacter sp.]|uniref:GIN domain-containing protein n=1 Tax=Pedobacter sp. TaxID=1411316 RepID=UPI002C1E2985|nr:DUF2807 domain-containing protein [Pedobacter sp.]HMI03147.1 DUF2807 domain-containing protein [Pedobacter sp.]
MKTLTKTAFAAVLTAVVLTSSAMTTFAAPFIKVAAITESFNKIWVSGNVKIILTQSEKEGVFVDEYFNPEKTSVIGKGQNLYINTMESSQVTIRISVKDLQRIEAAGSAVVVTENKFDVKYLQLFLSQNAKVKVDAKVGDLYTVISEDAVLKMSGATDQHTLIASNMKNVKLDNFVSLKTDTGSTDVATDSLTAATTK